MSVATPADSVVLCGLARALVQHQLLRLDQAVAIQKKADLATGKFIDELVISGQLPAVKLARFASDTFGLPMMDLAALNAAALPGDLIDSKLLGEARIIPLAKRGNRLTVLLSDPTDLQAIDRVKFQAQATVDPIVVEHDKLLKSLERLGKTASEQLSTLAGDSLDIELESGEPAPAVEDNSDIDDAPVVRFLQKILMDAINGGASDIHFEPYEKYYRIRYRVDGELKEVAQPPLAIKEKLASVGPYASLLVVYKGRADADNGNTVTVTLAGHYVGGEHDGKAAPVRQIIVRCDSTGWRLPSAKTAPGTPAAPAAPAGDTAGATTGATT